MDTQAVFGLSILMGFVAFGLVTKLYHLAAASKTGARRCAPSTGAAAYVSVCWPELPGSRGCLRVASVGLRQSGCIRRFRCSDTCSRGDDCAGPACAVGDGVRLVVQRMGRGGLPIRVLPRIVRGPARRQDAWRRVFHSHGDRAPAPYHAWPDILASCPLQALERRTGRATFILRASERDACVT